jgi:hypothetical protein
VWRRVPDWRASDVWSLTSSLPALRLPLEANQPPGRRRWSLLPGPRRGLGPDRGHGRPCSIPLRRPVQHGGPEGRLRRCIAKMRLLDVTQCVFAIPPNLKRPRHALRIITIEPAGLRDLNDLATRGSPSTRRISTGSAEAACKYPKRRTFSCWGYPPVRCPLRSRVWFEGRLWPPALIRMAVRTQGMLP